MKKLKLSELPTETQLYLNSVFNNKSSLENKESFTYCLRMFWICRFDKFRAEEKKHFDIISTHFVDDTFKYNFNNAPAVLIECDNHMRLSKEIFDYIYNIYFPVDKKSTSLFSKIKKLFK